MLSVLADPHADQARRDRMAESSAPFCHPRLGLVSPTDATNGAGHIQNITIIGIPRGCQFNPATQMIVGSDGVETDPPRFVPATPTPALTDQSELPPPAELEPTPEPLPVVEPAPADDGKVTALSAWRRRAGDEDSGAQ
jgi:hypothetical protein